MNEIKICLHHKMGNNIYESYLSKHKLHEIRIDADPESELNYIIVIPAYYEPDIILTLDSLAAITIDHIYVEIIIVLNYSESSDESVITFHSQQFKEIQHWINLHSNQFLKFYCTTPIVFKDKVAGVGSARKAGMDEAVNRFKTIGNQKGVIINLDADCLVHKDYLKTIDGYFNSLNHKPCVSINFSHRLDVQENSLAIQEYELHLRYYIAVQKYIHYPFAFQTLGSCFAVKALDYCRQGGMNQRKAGEDFYFLHKFSIINQLDEIEDVLVYPSSRKSLRVPFGTGKAIYKYDELSQQLTYSLDALLLFGRLISNINSWDSNHSIEQDLKNIHPQLAIHFTSEGIIDEINLCKKNCANNVSFQKRMMRWLNPFRLMKYLHYMREHGFPDQDVKNETRKFLKLSSNLVLQNALERICKL